MEQLSEVLSQIISMVCADRRRVVFLAALLIVIPPVTLSAESGPQPSDYSDHHLENDSQHTRFRDKRTLDFILHGLAQLLGYRLERSNAKTATTTPTPPVSTAPPKLITQPTPATPSQIVFLSLSDLADLKSKQAATSPPRHSADTDSKRNYPYARHRIGSGYERGGHDNGDTTDHYYKSDYSHDGHDNSGNGCSHIGPNHDKGGDKSSQYLRTGHGRGGSDRRKDGHGGDGNHYYRSRYRSDKIDDYLERIGHYVKDQIRGGKGDKDEEKKGHNSQKSSNFNQVGASKPEERGNTHKWNKEHVKSEHDVTEGFDHGQDSHGVSQGNSNGVHETDAMQEKQKEDTRKSDEAELKGPENIKQKETSMQNIEQEDSEEEAVEEEQVQKATQEVAEKEDVEQEHADNSKQESDENDTTDQKQGEQTRQEEDRKEEKHQEGDHHNQIPAPSLQTWDEDFWNSHSFADNNPYSFGVVATQRSHTDEQKDSHKIPDFSFGRLLKDQDNKDLKPAQREQYYSMPQYFDEPRFERVHEWHVTSDRQSEKPSSVSSIHKESSEPQSELEEEEEDEVEEEEEETLRGSSDSPENPDSSDIKSPEASEPPTYGHDVTDSPPMPVHSTSKPKLAQLIHEMEGTKQNPLWPPPFDHAFESTDSSVVAQRPEQTNVTLSKDFPGHTSPFLLNLYNYTSISDYLLDLNKKDMLHKQPSQTSQKHTKSDHASQNYKSPVSYVAVVVPNESRNKHAEKSNHSTLPEPSFVGVVYPQRLLPKEANSKVSGWTGGASSAQDLRIPSNSPHLHSHYQTENIQQYFDSHYDNPLLLNHGTYPNRNSPTEASSSTLDSRTPSNYLKEHIHDYPDTFYSSFLENTGINPSRDGSSSVLNSRHPNNSSGETYSHIENADVINFPQVYYSSFQNDKTQPLGSSSPHSSYNYQGYQGDKIHSPSTFYSDGRQQGSSTSKPLRLVIPDLQPYTSSGSRSSQLRVVVPDFPQGDSSFDYSSGDEQNESKNEPFEQHFGLMTIPPPTPYIDEPASLKNPEKWVLGDDAVSNSKNLKTKEHITRVSKVRITGKVDSKPTTNLKTV